MGEEGDGRVCYKVHEPGRIVILKLPDDSLFCVFLRTDAAKSKRKAAASTRQSALHWSRSATSCTNWLNDKLTILKDSLKKENEPP